MSLLQIILKALLNLQKYNTEMIKHPFVAATILGGFAALGFAPVFAFPLTFIAFMLFFQLLDHESTRNKGSFKTAWFFALGYYIVGLYWIALSLHVNWGKFGWLFPFALVGLPSIFALFPALACKLYTKLTPPFKILSTFQRIGAVFLFAALWAFMEWVRGHAFTGFPWQLPSDIWMGYLPMAQPLSHLGSYGYSLITLMMFLLIPAFGRKVLMVLIFTLSSIYFWGQSQLSDGTSYQPGIQVALIQPNVSQKTKWDASLYRYHIDNLVTLSSIAPQPVNGQTVYIWPEACVPFRLEDKLLSYITAYMQPKDLLMFGSPYTSPDGNLYNSLFVVDAKGQVLASYVKSHLVPFGEYMPFRNLLPEGIGKITAGARDFTPGPGLEALSIDDTPTFTPLICYEIIFPGAVVPKVSKRPQWIVNITNDGWYLNSSGPYQHLQNTRARAIEEGIPVVRVANTGISAVIDPQGRIIASAKYGEEASLVSRLPKPLENVTPYGQFGDLIFFIMLLFSFILGLGFIKLRKPTKLALSVRSQS